MTSIREMFGDFNEGSENAFNPLRHPKTALKIKHAFEKARIKTIKFARDFNEDTCFEDLTLLTYPSIGVDSEYVDLTNDRTKLYQVIKEMKGYYSYCSSYGIPKIDDKKKILVNIKNGAGVVKDYEMGCYIKERNVIMIYLPIFCSHLDKADKNEYLFFFIDNLVKWMKKNRVKKSNTTKFMEKKMLEKFCEDAKMRIRSSETSITTRKQSILSRAESDIIDYRAITTDEELVKSLGSMMKNINKEISKQINEVKSLKFVKSANLTIKGIEIDVGEIKIKYARKEVYIGNFRIFLTPTNIQIKNKKRLKYAGDGYAKGLIHPHIDYGNDSHCYGSDRKKEIHKLLAKNEFKKLTYMLYLFLKSYNGNDKYHNIKFWTMLNDKGESIYNTSEGNTRETREAEQRSERSRARQENVPSFMSPEGIQSYVSETQTNTRI